MEKSWTSAQLSAIESSGRDLLISAGAGSGKTAVLTERIIRHLTDPENPADLNRMLIVTYTQAAAGELKTRISGAITKAIAERPWDKRLSRQLFAMDRAKISTIHSFCLDILRENIEATGLPANFRIADSAEIALLRTGIMNDLIEEYFSTGVADYPIDGFGEFADTFASAKNDDELAAAFLKIEESLSCCTDHIGFIRKFADELRADIDDFGSSRCAKEILSTVKTHLSPYRDMFASVTAELLSDEKLKVAYYPVFENDIEFIDCVVDACERGDYFGVSALLSNFSPMSLKSSKGAALSKNVEYVRAERDSYKDEIRKKFYPSFFSLTKEELAQSCRDTADALDKLYTLLAAFGARFAAEKRERGIADFNDLERFAYRILVDENGEPTDVARSVSSRFDEVYIDEYQDVNSVQDAIFAAVSNGHNRFMVGDIKQSIYGFRGAEPMIFASYRRKFGTLDDAGDNGAAIFLSNNFRCDKSVIDFTNIVSGCLFTSGRRDIPFDNEDMLIHSKAGDESGEPVHVVLVDAADDDGESDVSMREAEYVASEIERLLKNGKKNDGTPIRPCDIAILMLSEKAHSEALGAALSSRSIPYHTGAEGGFFENAEVLLALCILNIIDNPTRDIYLTGALKSPVFGFTLDELVKIKRAYPDGCLWDALRAYCEDVDFSKGAEFLATLERWREKAKGLAVDKLLWSVYTDTDLLSLVYDKENRTRRANLMLLYEYARRFEASSFKGLYNFIRYINDILEEKAELKSAQTDGEASDTVKFMTIHHSKGLEYPVCFICGAGKQFNEADLRKNIIIEKGLGIAPKLSDATGFARYDTPVRHALISRLYESMLEEEMRVLYVAMTRARERLYVTGLVKDATDTLEKARKNADMFSRSVVMKNGGFMYWILAALARHERLSDAELPYVVETVGGTAEGTTAEQGTEPVECECVGATDELRALVRERFDFVYPHAAASKLPAKLSVSKLVPTLLDEDAAELDDESEPYDFEAKRPLFLDGEAAPTLTGAERGTATHTFMQFCDFSRFVGADDIAQMLEDEAARLIELKFITKRMASLMNMRQLARFFTGDTFEAISKSRLVVREHRFNVKLPASDFTENAELAAALDGESVLVQGVIDCFFENSDGTITLIDYKTDYIPPELDFDGATKLLLERHRLQLLYYKAACERITRKRVSRVAIYSFALGCAIEME